MALAFGGDASWLGPAYTLNGSTANASRILRRLSAVSTSDEHMTARGEIRRRRASCSSASARPIDA